MEQGLSSHIRDYFSIEEKDIRQYSPLTLAFLGDAVYEMVVRSIIVDKGNTAPATLHKHSAHIVKAPSQRMMLEAIESELTEEETEVYKRGRNTKSYTRAKNATVHDYRIATGFEALIGYLYLKDELERVLWLIRTGLERTGLDNEGQ